MIYLSNQALIQKRGQSFENIQCHPIEMMVHPVGHCLNRFECATCEHGEQREQSLLTIAKQFIAPVNGVAQSLMSNRQIPRPAPKQL